MRLRTLVLACILAITSLATVASAQDDLEPVPVDIDGFPLAISPDGNRVAGVHEDGDRFCVWDIASGDAACDGILPEPVEARSVTWAPDSSAVAFSLNTPNRLVDSDIYLFEVASGTLHNLTDDDPGDTGADRVSFLAPPESPVAIDRFPAWSPDGGSLLFARTVWGDATAPGVELMTIPREGGDPATFAVLDDVAPLAVPGPMLWRDDGSILLTTRHPDPLNATNAIWLLEPDGSLTHLVDGTAAGAITDPLLASVAEDGTAVSAWSWLDFHEALWATEIPIFFRVDVESGAATPWTDVPGVDLPDRARLLAPPVFGPDDAVAFLWRIRDGGMGVSILDPNGSFRTVAEVRYMPGGPVPTGINTVSPALHWADDGTLLVLLNTGGVIIPFDAGNATPVASLDP
jgi:dipeptidyl aminopeptidase/acylaminoacyl peptidase